MNTHVDSLPGRTDRHQPSAGCRRFIFKLSAASKLSGEDDHTLAELCKNVRSTPANQDIISEGDNPQHVHIMLEGWAARYKILRDGSRQITAFLIPGDFCDLHVAILGYMDHGILALTSARVAYVPHNALDELPISHPRLGRALWRATLIDEAVLRSWIVNNGRREAGERIAHLFCELHARLTLVGLVENGTFALPLTQEVIADATGLTRIHVSRMLRKLRAEDLIKLDEGELTIMNVQKLSDIASFDASYLHRESLQQV
jgi:CRP-like cAMP-binding protein